MVLDWSSIRLCKQYMGMGQFTQYDVHGCEMGKQQLARGWLSHLFAFAVLAKRIILGICTWHIARSGHLRRGYFGTSEKRRILINKWNAVYRVIFARVLFSLILWRHYNHWRYRYAFVIQTGQISSFENKVVLCTNIGEVNWLFNVTINDISVISKNWSTEGCSKLKSPETRQVQERLVSTLEHLQVPKWDRTRCPEE